MCVNVYKNNSTVLDRGISLISACVIILRNMYMCDVFSLYMHSSDTIHTHTCVVYSTCTYVCTFLGHDTLTCTCVAYSAYTYVRTFLRHDTHTHTCVVYSTCTYVRTFLRHDTLTRTCVAYSAYTCVHSSDKIR